MNMYKRGHYLSSIKLIQEKLKEDYDIKIKPWRLMHLLHHHMYMGYKKVNEISLRSNDPKNLILRQQFARTFLKLDLHSKIIINVDETWIGQTDFRRRKWTFLKQPDSVPKKQVQPRISMIAGIDTTGKVYLSLL